MTEFFVPRTGELKLATGVKQVVVKGIRDLPDAVADDPAATRYGIKPVHEMTPAERVEHKLPKAAPDVDPSIKVEPEASESPAKPDPAPIAAQVAPKTVLAATDAPGVVTRPVA